jgi:TonB family protein
MLKFGPAICLVLAACATGTPVRGDREGAARFEPAADAGLARAFPQAHDPQLPSADRISRRLRDEIGDVASAEVRLCVGPDGRVQRVQVLRGSSSPAFDDALVRDMSDWQFSGTAGTTTSLQRQSCEIAKISYRVH